MNAQRPSSWRPLARQVRVGLQGEPLALFRLKVDGTVQAHVWVLPHRRVRSDNTSEVTSTGLVGHPCGSPSCKRDQPPVAPPGALNRTALSRRNLEDTLESGVPLVPNACQTLRSAMRADASIKSALTVCISCVHSKQASGECSRLGNGPKSNRPKPGEQVYRWQATQ